MGRSLKNIVAGLSERERHLVGAMALIFVLLIIFLSVFVFSSKIGDLEDEDEQLTASLRLLEEKAEDYKEQQRAARQSSRRATQKPTPLPTLVDKTCKKLDVEMPDVKELPDQRHGTKWLEHSVELSMREIDLLKLTQFMEEVESNRRRFPIAISKLDINKRKRPTGISFQVKMTISTYEEEAEAPSEAEGPSTPSRKRPSRAKKRKGGR
jgi:type II secretory pathway component PulM